MPTFTSLRRAPLAILVLSALTTSLLLLTGCSSGNNANHAPAEYVTESTTVLPDESAQTITIDVDHGYSPQTIYAKPDIPIHITFHREEENESCAREVEVPAVDYKAVIPNHGATLVKVPAQATGEEIAIHCSMDHMRAKIVVTDAPLN